MYPAAPSANELLAIHAALIEGCQAELALAYDPRVSYGVALVVLPHGSPVAQVAFGSRAEVARELTAFSGGRGAGGRKLGARQCRAARLCSSRRGKATVRRGRAREGAHSPDPVAPRGAAGDRSLSIKTHWTAAVLIPPPECWEPIQAIRRLHDRKIGRWMPHVTLLYPFRARVEFDAIASALTMACALVSPFTLTLQHFEYFDHGRGRFTVWLDPQPHEPITALHAALLQVVPDCDDTARRARGLKPHLSVGQAQGRAGLATLLGEVEPVWTPLVFEVHAVALIAREGETPFIVERSIPLGTEPAVV